MDNVINFPDKSPIFGSELRHKLEHGIKPFTEKPQETVTTVEQVICSHIILIARRVAAEIGRKLGEKIAGKLVVNE